MQRQLADLWFAGQIETDAYVKGRAKCRNALKEAMKRIDHVIHQSLRMAR